MVLVFGINKEKDKQRPLDDNIAKKKVKDAKFNGKKSTKDEYTGEKIFYGNKADSKYKHPSNKLCNVDHVVPLNKIDKKYPNLSDEQKKKIANNKNNLVVSNASLNCSKKDKSNIEYVAGKFMKGTPVDSKTAANMIKKQVKADATVNYEAAKMQMKNIFEKNK